MPSSATYKMPCPVCDGRGRMQMTTYRNVMRGGKLVTTVQKRWATCHTCDHGEITVLLGKDKVGK